MNLNESPESRLWFISNFTPKTMYGLCVNTLERKFSNKIWDGHEMG